MARTNGAWHVVAHAARGSRRFGHALVLPAAMFASCSSQPAPSARSLPAPASIALATPDRPIDQPSIPGPSLGLAEHDATPDAGNDLPDAADRSASTGSSPNRASRRTRTSEADVPSTTDAPPIRSQPASRSYPDDSIDSQTRRTGDGSAREPTPDAASSEPPHASTEDTSDDADADASDGANDEAGVRRIRELALRVGEALASVPADQPLSPGESLALAAFDRLIAQPAGLPFASTPLLDDPSAQAVLEATVDALQNVAEAARSDDPLASAADSAQALARELGARAGVRIAHAAWCERVLGFSRYVEIPAGRVVMPTQATIVLYTELEHVATRPARQTDSGWTVGDTQTIELGQTLILYSASDTDPVQVWSLPKQSVALTGRRPPRDVFLRLPIELPRGLTLGRYRMKIIVRDETTGSVDETMLPLELVAQGTDR